LSESLRAVAELVVPVGTQVVLREEINDGDEGQVYPKGTVAEIISVPTETRDTYQARCLDKIEILVRRDEFSILKQVKSGPLGDPLHLSHGTDLSKFIIYSCVVGSQAFGLSRDDSDVDRRGIYLPPADLEWSLYGLPEQLENPQTEDCFWEFKKFVVLALKANPNILECLFTPIVEKATELAEELLAQRSIFLSQLVYQTYNGYVMSQFKKLEQDIRVKGEIKWKHAMHLIRLLLQGTSILKDHTVPVRVAEYRDELLSVRDGLMPWDEVNRWRLSLHSEFEAAFRVTTLPESPDYEAANRLLIRARRTMVEVHFDS
jgi:uncharacterized protein